MEANYYIENKEFNGLEIYFKERPQTNILEILKANKWKWHNIKKCWFAKSTQENLEIATRLTSGEAVTKENLIINNKEIEKENMQSQYKYCYNGIYTESGEYIKANYNIDEITSEIYLFLDTYKILHNAPSGTYQNNDSDIMTDYFDKTTLYIKPESKEFLNALTGFKKQWEHQEKLKEKAKNKNYYVQETTQKQKELYNERITKAEELARNFINLDYDTANKIYSNFVEANKKRHEEQQQQEKLESTKNDIKRLQESKQNIENGEFSYYDEILENDNFIIAISKEKYNIIDFTPNCMEKFYIDYNVRVIDKNNFTHDHLTTRDENEKNEYIKKYIA